MSATVSAPAPQTFAQRLQAFAQRRPAILVFLLAFGGSLLVQGIERFYYYGDSWWMLHQLMADPKTLLAPHNEYLLPVFKAFYYAQFLLFGGHHVPMMVVGFLLHAGNAALVFLLARRARLSPSGALAAAMLFTFSSVPWEVTGWSFEQCIELATLFGLAALLLLAERPHEPRRAWLIGLLSLLSFYCGPVAAAVPPILTAFYVLVGWPSRPRGAWPVVKVGLAIWLPLVLYVASFMASADISEAFGPNRVRFGLDSLLPLVHYTFYGVSYGLVHPTLTLVNTAVLAGVVGVVAALSLWRLRPGTERRWFLFLLAFVFICIAVTGVARSQFGPITSASSRYQYQPGAGLAVLMVLAWQPLVRALDSRRRRLGMALSALALFYLLGAHVYRIRWQNESANRGLEAQAFLRVGRASVTAEGAGSGRPLGPDVPLPYAAFAPGTFPLWAALQVLEGTRERILPVGDFLGSKDGEWEGNELRGGGFETDSAVAFWKVFGEATVRRSQGAALHGTAGAQVGLRGLASAVSRDVVTRCPEELEGRAYSFRLSVRTTDAKLVSRMVFKARDGKILGIFSSPGHAGDGAWHPLVTGGLAPKGACVVGVDLTSSAPTPTTAQVDDALFLSHPASVDGAGRLLPAPR